LKGKTIYKYDDKNRRFEERDYKKFGESQLTPYTLITYEYEEY